MNKNQPKRRGLHPVIFALAVAIFGVLAMLLVDHGPWSRPNVQAATGGAAHAAGAQVMPTEPKPELEPAAPGPKPAQPANPQTP
jgi:hypothetical protein